MFVVGFPIVALFHTRYFTSMHFKTQQKNIINSIYDRISLKKLEYF